MSAIRVIVGVIRLLLPLIVAFAAMIVVDGDVGKYIALMTCIYSGIFIHEYVSHPHKEEKNEQK